MPTMRVETSDGEGNVLHVEEIEVEALPPDPETALAAVQAADTFEELKTATAAYLAQLT